MSTSISSCHIPIEIKTSKGYKIICIKNILYIEAARKCSIIYLDNTELIITYHLLKWYERYLLKPYFFRCHNSYIINCQFVDFYWNEGITLTNSSRIPISRNKVALFKENLRDLIIELHQ